MGSPLRARSRSFSTSFSAAVRRASTKRSLRRQGSPSVRDCSSLATSGMAARSLSSDASSSAFGAA